MQEDHKHSQLMELMEQEHGEHEDSGSYEQYHEQYHEQHEQQRELIEQKGSFAELVVRAATACNKMILENCSICTLYCDKQVQYETAVMERYVTGNGLSDLTDLFRRLEDDQGVEEYREKLFDEQSVVQSVSSRQED